MKKLLGFILSILILTSWYIASNVEKVNAQSTVLGSICYTSNGRNCEPSIQSASSAKVSVATSTTIEIIALATGKAIYVTSFDLVTTAANTSKWVYGTGTACATGQTDLTGAYGQSTFTVISKGNGLGTILFVPKSNALCLTTTTSAQTSGSVSYTQF